MGSDDTYDVAILGGGLAGLCLGLQLKRERPETSVYIAERRSGPAPLAAFKVGESTVEAAAHYFGEVLGLQDHLEAEQLPKAMLRFFFPAGDNRDFTRRVELGITALPPVPAYQLDRGRFENELAKRNLEAGVDLRGGARVQEVELSSDGGHVITVLQDDVTSQVRARWVVDASGRKSLLKQKLGLFADVEHDANASWLRLAGDLDLEQWGAHDPQWMARMSEPGVRHLSTNHLMGEGYWVWLIPLYGGSISIGIVADPRFHPFNEMNTLDGAIEWFKRHEPPLGEELDRRRDDVEDFLKIERFSFGATQVYSPDRWALTGEAAMFADAFYSPGSDYIALGNSFTTELIKRDLDGEDITERAGIYNVVHQTVFSMQLQAYTNQYSIWGNTYVMSAKLVWDHFVYWGILVPLYINRKWKDVDYMVSRPPETARLFQIAPRAQDMFRDWSALESRDLMDRILTWTQIPELWKVHEELALRLDNDALNAKALENFKLVEAVTVLMFQRAVTALGRSIDDNTKIRAEGISMDPERWDQDGLFDDSGISPAEAAALVPGLDELWAEPAAAGA